jgi:hypothetical protein
MLTRSGRHKHPRAFVVFTSRTPEVANCESCKHLFWFCPSALPKPHSPQVTRLRLAHHCAQVLSLLYFELERFTQHSKPKKLLSVACLGSQLATFPTHFALEYTVLIVTAGQLIFVESPCQMASILQSRKTRNGKSSNHWGPPLRSLY